MSKRGKERLIVMRVALKNYSKTSMIEQISRRLATSDRVYVAKVYAETVGLDGIRGLD